MIAKQHALLAATLLLVAVCQATSDHHPTHFSRADLFGGSNRKLHAAVVNNTQIPAWRGRLDTVYNRSYFAPAVSDNACDGKQTCTGILPGRSYPYEEYIIDPTDPDSGRPVMKITYPEGSWSPSAQVPGGTLFFAYPYKYNPNAVDNPFSRHGATLEYQVYFPEDFNWNKGGKLPGLGGGSNGGRGCGGGINAFDCFSYRIMWRRDGWGEAYLYVPERGFQDSSFCGSAPDCQLTKVKPCTECSWDAGIGFMRGSFIFQTGKWHTLRLSMVLNTPNVTDGVIKLNFDGVDVFQYSKVNWRRFDNVSIEGVNVATWFGGGDSTWAPNKTTHTLFRNFKLFYDAPNDSVGTVQPLSTEETPQSVAARVAAVVQKENETEVVRVESSSTAAVFLDEEPYEETTTTTTISPRTVAITNLPATNTTAARSALLLVPGMPGDPPPGWTGQVVVKSVIREGV